MSNYSLGFYFDITMKNVLLAYRLKDDWQKNLLNGVGGMQEPLEPMIDCMDREFSEETSIISNKRDWVNFCRLQLEGYYVECYFYLSRNDFKGDFIQDSLKHATESIHIISVKDIYHYPCVPNVYWLVPMALSYKFRNCNKVTVNYESHGV